MGKGRDGEAEMKKSLRETLRPLKSLKTAKSSDFRAQRNQELSKTHDFAGETFSFRFASSSFRAEREIPFWESRHGGGLEASKIWKTPRLAKNPCPAT
jgi:hypothetical protein